MHKKFAEISELVALVSHYLTTQELFVCVQVSSHWHHTFIPFLWHTINDTTFSWNYILHQCGDPGIPTWTYHLDEKLIDADKNKDRDWLIHVFSKYGRHIRDLTIHWPMVLEAASMASLGDINSDGSDGLTTLRSLTLEMRTPYPPQPVIPGRSDFIDHVPNSPRPMITTMPPLAISAPLFPGVVEEADFIQPRHYHLTIEFQREALERGWAWTQHYWNIILRNRRLTRLIFGPIKAYQSHLWVVKSKDVFLRGVAKMKHLTELHGLEFVNLSGVWELLAAVPTLESLETTCHHDQLPSPLPAANRTLRALTVHGTLSINSLLDILGLFPCLSTLTVTTVGSQAAQEQLEDVRPRDPSIGANLRELLARVVIDYDTLFRHLPDHVELTWIDGTDSNHRVSLQLPEHSARFSVFKADHPPWYIDEVFEGRPPHDVANELLVTSSRLRVFDNIRHYIRVDEMLRQPWACMGLEWLTCRIVGVDRLTDEEQSLVDRVLAPGYAAELSGEEGAAVEKSQRCRTQHHGIYDRLASLTKLKRLDLGYENRYPWAYKSCDWYEVDGESYLEYEGPTFDTLELSLASGLERLGALKNLEMFGFECVNHRIGRAELDWMAKSWPKLNLMYGLDKERLMDIEYSKERAALKEYFQELRPDVVHDSLFEDNV